MRNILGDPTRCLNRNCKHEFYKESNIGYIPQSPAEVAVVMMCPKCHDVFAITQIPSMVEDYMNSLKAEPKSKLPKITRSELVNIQNSLIGDDNILSSILEAPLIDEKN